MTSWRCSICAVVVRYLPGHPVPALPEGWARDGRKLTCLACRRCEVLGQAKAAGANRSEAKRALIRFEIQRDPAAPSAQIVSRVHSTPMAVARERRALIDGGLIAPARRSRQRASESRARVEAALRADPERSDASIRREVGTHPRLIREVRRRLEAEGAIPARERRAA